MKRFVFIMLSCCFCAAIGLTACGDDIEEPKKEMLGVFPIMKVTMNEWFTQDENLDIAIDFTNNNYSTSDGTTATANTVLLYIDNALCDSKPYSKNVRFSYPLASTSHGKHKVSFKVEFSANGYNTKEIDGKNEQEIIVFNEKPKHEIMLHVESSSVIETYYIIDDISGLTVRGEESVKGMNAYSSNNTIAWTHETKHITGAYTDPNSSLTHKTDLWIPAQDERIDVKGTVTFDPEKTNFEGKFTKCEIRWGTEDSAPSDVCSFIFSRLNSFDYIYVTYQYSGTKEGIAFDDRTNYTVRYNLEKK